MAPSDYLQNCVRSLGKRKVSGKTCESPQGLQDRHRQPAKALQDCAACQEPWLWVC